MAASLASFKSAGRAQILPAQAPTSPLRTSEKFWRSASLSASCSTTSRENDSSASHEIVICHSQFCCSCRVYGRKCVDTAIPSCYFSTAEDFSHSHHSRRHGKPAQCRSLLRKSSSPKASVNIAKGFRASSSPCGTQGLRHATLSAYLRSFRPTAN